MAKNTRSALSPIAAEERAVAFLVRIGAVAPSHDAVYVWVDGKPIRKRGKLRSGQHRGHRCSATSRGNGKRTG